MRSRERRRKRAVNNAVVNVHPSRIQAVRDNINARESRIKIISDGSSLFLSSRLSLPLRLSLSFPSTASTIFVSLSLFDAQTKYIFYRHPQKTIDRIAEREKERGERIGFPFKVYPRSSSEYFCGPNREFRRHTLLSENAGTWNQDKSM